MQSKLCALVVIIIMALWQLMLLDTTAHYVSRCVNCYKTKVVMTGKEHCFHIVICCLSVLLKEHC